MITFYYWLGSGIILTQLFCVLLVFRNSRFSLSKYRKVRSWYRPKTVLIVPCKGIDLDFERNIASLFGQDFNNYLLWFVVESEQDPAYEKLCSLKESLCPKSQAIECKIWVSGIGKICSQKIHNLLYCYERIPDDTEVLAFADSDICVRKDWLSHLVYPLRQQKNGVASGYRWFVPKRNNLPTLALSAGNAKVAQLLGNSLFNQAWGGSMAVRVEVFRELDISKIWQTALSDDLSLSRAVKKAKLQVAFVPACMVPSFEDTTWLKAFEFVRRQFLITKVFSPGTWWFSIISMTGAMFATWVTLVVALLAAISGLAHLRFFIAVPAVSVASQFIRACMRQFVASKLLRHELSRMKLAIASDILFFWAWSVILWVLIVSTSFGRTVRWRGIRYKMLSPTETVRLKD
jgi:cellulose synthase/poly-beta-1,6-N-acetylglucosamine synthase-like glycosyltransferase